MQHISPTTWFGPKKERPPEPPPINDLADLESAAFQLEMAGRDATKHLKYRRRRHQKKSLDLSSSARPSTFTARLSRAARRRNTFDGSSHRASMSADHLSDDGATKSSGSVDTIRSRRASRVARQAGNVLRSQMQRFKTSFKTLLTGLLVVFIMQAVLQGTWHFLRNAAPRRQLHIFFSCCRARHTTPLPPPPPRFHTDTIHPMR